MRLPDRSEAHDLAQRLERLEEQIRELRALLAQPEAPEAYAVPPEIPTAHPHHVRIYGVQGGEPIVRGAIA